MILKGFKSFTPMPFHLDYTAVYLALSGFIINPNIFSIARQNLLIPT